MIANPPAAPVGCVTCGAQPGQRCETGLGTPAARVHAARAEAVVLWLEAQAGKGATVTDLSSWRATKRAAERDRVETIYVGP